MASIFGTTIKVSIFGQSHAPAIGVTIDGLPVGEVVDEAQLRAFLARRAPGGAAWSTQRKEPDTPEILCGVASGRTCGAPLTVIIRNTDVRPGDYSAFPTRRARPTPTTPAACATAAGTTPAAADTSPAG